jgi:hypothetical protein
LIVSSLSGFARGLGRGVERAVEAAKRSKLKSGRYAGGLAFLNLRVVGLNDTAIWLIGGFTRTALSWRWINDHVCINARDGSAQHRRAPVASVRIKERRCIPIS